MEYGEKYATSGPFTAIFDNPIARVLDQSLIVGNMEQTIAMLAESTNLSYKTVLSAVKRLEEIGFVKATRKIGNAQAYRFEISSDDFQPLLQFGENFQFRRLETRNKNILDLEKKVSASIPKLRRFDMQLGNLLIELKHRDASLFDKCVKAQQNMDVGKATMFANECAQIRGLIQNNLRSRAAIEIILSTLGKFGDTKDSIRNLFPIKSVLLEFEKDSEILVGKDNKVNELVRIVNDLTSSYKEIHPSVELEESNKEAVPVYNEIDSLAEKRMKELIGTSPIPQPLKH